jgi:hypothetical protein
MKTKLTQTEIDTKLKRLWKQGFAVGASSRDAGCGYSYASAKFYDWEVEKALEAQLERSARELYVQQSMLPGKKSNFVLCTTNTEVLDAYKAFTGKEYVA